MIDLSDKKSLYTIFPKRKSNGKIRWIHAPNEILKVKQKELQNKLEEKYVFPDYVFGSIKGKSVKDGLSQHVGKKWLAEIDIKDFFPSITKDMLIERLDLTDYESELATYNEKLVQGSPCSSILSNALMLSDDIFFYKYLKELLDIDYSRYVDNIIISGKDKNDILVAIETIKFRLIQFKIKKPRIISNNFEQKVLGVTLNTKISISYKERKKLKNAIKYEGLDKQKEGYLSYINSISKEEYYKLRQKALK